MKSFWIWVFVIAGAFYWPLWIFAGVLMIDQYLAEMAAIWDDDEDEEYPTDRP